MKRLAMQSTPRLMKALALAWDARSALYGGPGAIVARQRARLADIVAYARVYSPYYRDLP